MEATWPSVLINGAVVIFLGGLIWRSSGHRLDRLESGLGKTVEKEYCQLQHAELREDLRELKQGQKEMLVALREIETRLARRSGEERAKRETGRRVGGE